MLRLKAAFICVCALKTLDACCWGAVVRAGHCRSGSPHCFVFCFLFFTTGKSRATDFKPVTHLVCSPVELINSFLPWKVAQRSGPAVGYCVKLLLVFRFQALLLVSYWFDKWNMVSPLFPGNGVKGNWSAHAGSCIYYCTVPLVVCKALSWSITKSFKKHQTWMF